MIRTKIGDTQGSLWGEEIHIFVGPTMAYGHLRLCDGWRQALLYSKVPRWTHITIRLYPRIEGTTVTNQHIIVQKHLCIAMH